MKGELTLQKKLEKSNAQFKKQWEIMKTLCTRKTLNAKELSAAGDRIVEKYKVFLEEAASTVTVKRLENENSKLKMKL